MASYKDTFAAKHFAANHFASGHWRGKGVAVTSILVLSGTVHVYPLRNGTASMTGQYSGTVESLT